MHTLDEVTARRDELERELREIDHKAAEAEQVQGLAVANGDDAGPATAEAAELRVRREAVVRAVSILTAHAGELERVESERTREIATARMHAAVETARGAMKALDDSLRAYLAGEYGERSRALTEALEALRPARKALRQATGESWSFDSVGETLWSAHAPLLVVVQDLEAFEARRPIYQIARNVHTIPTPEPRDAFRGSEGTPPTDATAIALR